MNYEEAKVYKQELENKNNIDSDTLKSFEKYGISPLGGAPDHVREMPEWKKAKKEFDKSFAELRNFNGWYVKTFKKELAKDRRKRFAAKAI